MLTIGSHLSAAKGFVHMGQEALQIGANTFQFFTRNPRGSKAKKIDLEDIAAFQKLAESHQFGTILAHAPYTINPCSGEERTREFAFETMTDDLQRLEHTPGTYYNFHPGSHVGQGAQAGIDMIAGLLNKLLRPDQRTTVLLETMSGKGSEIGSTFEELRHIIDKVELRHKLGVCLDTCHVYDAGYDIVNDLDGVLDGFDKTIGLDRLLAIHLNDSKNPFGSHKDRHEKIGHGMLGLEAITKVITHPKLRHLPFFLETPNDLDGYGEEIKLLRQRASRQP